MAAVLLVGMTVSIGAWGWTAAVSPSGLSATDQNAIKSGINPNTATWYELAQLPGLGESAGRAIEAYRIEQERAGRAPAFKNAADLEPVPGIGTATIARIQRHLDFGADTFTTTRPTKP